jgi:hypothetical protein
LLRYWWTVEWRRPKRSANWYSATSSPGGPLDPGRDGAGARLPG